MIEPERRQRAKAEHESGEKDSADRRSARFEPNLKFIAAREAIPSLVSPGYCMSRAELAEAVHLYLWEKTKKKYDSMDAHAIGKYERGEVRWPTARYREAFREILGASNDLELGFHPTPRGNTTPRAEIRRPGEPHESIGNAVESEHSVELHRSSASADGTVRMVHVIVNPLDWETEDKTKRRTFLAQAAGTVATILTSLDYSRDRIVNGNSSPRSSLDAETLEGLEQTTLGLRRAYRSAGALSLLGPSYGTLNLLAEMGPRSGKHQDRVITAIGQTAALIGIMLSLDLEEFDAGQRYLSVAVRAAQQAGNNDLLAFSLGARAFHAAYGGDPLAGRDYADSALNIAARGISPLTHGWLSAVASEMHAIDNNELLCRQLLDNASAHLANADPAEPWIGVGVFNTEKLMAYLGGDLMRLGRYRDAQDVLRDALERLDPSLAKHRCTAYVDLAEAYAADGKVDEASDHASNAVAIVANTRHAGSLRRVELLYKNLKNYNSSATRRLGQQLIEMKAAW